MDINSEIPRSTLKIWHKEKHDDYSVSEISCFGYMTCVEKLMKEGGFWLVDPIRFIPWSSVSFIEVEEHV